MNKFIENVMSFINENTTLLIIICVFLIFVLVGYLIDNSIKTKKLAKMEKSIKKDHVIDNNVPEVKEEVKAVEVSEPTPVVEEPVSIIEETAKIEEPIIVAEESTPVVEPIIPEEPKVETEEVKVNEITEPVEVKANEFKVDPAINELLSRDFTKQDNVINYETEKEEVTISPIQQESTLESPGSSEDKNPYKNAKSLSEILGKKNVEVVKEDKKELLNTVDFQNELDRILQKLNNDSDNQTTKDSTMDETQDFSNMF